MARTRLNCFCALRHWEGTWPRGREGSDTGVRIRATILLPSSGSKDARCAEALDISDGPRATVEWIGRRCSALVAIRRIRYRPYRVGRGASLQPGSATTVGVQLVSCLLL